ncbi:MAG: DUF11 domain-containing protein [Verrucomicrobia bacterium]|nr:DUF11 domain-containing protein [Verrucomicrobiota bacterium]
MKMRNNLFVYGASLMTAFFLACIPLGGTAQESGAFLTTTEEILTTETITRDGITYVRGSVPIPTGKLSSSGLLLEKIVPREVTVGKVFSYEYRAQNLTAQNLIDVAIYDKISENFETTASLPFEPKVQNGISKWDLGSLGPRESKVIRIEGRAMAEGDVTTCGWATFQPTVCDTISVTRASVELSVIAPEVSLSSQSLRYEVKIKNTGSSNLTNLRISGKIPNGLQSFSGAQVIELNSPFLAVGEEVPFTFELMSSAPGEYPLELEVTTAQGVQDKASVVSEVRAPKLEITADSPEERFIGREANICLVIENSGNAPARNVTIELSLPPGINFVSADESGRSFGSMVRWDISDLAAADKKDLCATVVATSPGEYAFSGVVSAQGLAARTASTSVRFAGIAAIAMDVRDLVDPVEIGKELVYEITVTNQGTAPASNVVLICEMEDSQEFITSYGESTAKLRK